MDVSPELEDVCQRKVVTSHQNDGFYEVYEKLTEHGVRSIPVLDDEGRLTGVLSLLDLLQLVFRGDQDPLLSRQVDSSLQRIRGALDGRFQHAVDEEAQESLIVTVGAMSAQGFTERLDQFPPQRLLVVSGDRPTIQLPALERGVRGLVVTGNYELSPGLLQLAKANDVTVIVSPFDTATTTMRIKSARIIAPAVQHDFISLSAKTSVEAARKTIDRSRQTVFPVVDDSGDLVGVLSKSDLVSPPKPQLILVDHNELGQAVQGAEVSEILEVLDHHRLGGDLRSSQPIRFINEPVGSTCTLVARMYRTANLEPNPGIALCMASGIISDTLYLRSPTTTDVDRDVLQWLGQFCEPDLEEYATEFFEIGSALRTRASADVVREDCKRFTERGHRFSISQIEEIGFDLFWKRKSELHQSLAELASEEGLDFAALLITDIASNGSMLLMSREPEGWEEINYPRVDKLLYKLDNVVSRKKQLLPLILRLLETEQAIG